MHVTEQVPCSAGRAELSLKSGRVGCVSHRSGSLPGGGGCGAGRQSRRLFCVRRRQVLEGDMGKGAKKLGGAEGPEAVGPRCSLGHANLLGRWEDIY